MKEALKLALEAFDSMIGRKPERVEQAITAIKEALAQPEQEPVAFFDPQSEGFYWAKPTKVIPPVTVDVEPLPLYTTPPQRTWTELTDEEIWTVLQFRGYNTDTIEIAKAIEAKLKEKNA